MQGNSTVRELFPPVRPFKVRIPKSAVAVRTAGGDALYLIGVHNGDAYVVHADGTPFQGWAA